MDVSQENMLTHDEMQEQAKILFKAVKEGEIAKIERLLEGKSDAQKRELVNTTLNNDVFKRTLLHYAAQSGYIEIVKLLIVKLLIENDANIDAKDHFGRTPLHWAVYSGDTEVVKLLIESGADINAKNMDNKTPRDFAVNKPAILHWFDLAENYKKASNKLEFIKKQEKDPLDFEFLIKLAFNSSIKENKCKYTAMEDTVFGQLYDKEKGLGQEQLVNILKIELPKYETIDIFKFIEIVAQKNHFFLPKDLKPEIFLLRSRMQFLLEEKEENMVNIISI